MSVLLSGRWCFAITTMYSYSRTSRDEEFENKLIPVIQAEVYCNLLNYLLACFDKCKMES